tara:strand:- start:2434 stop:2595 length:162 start_codon:yes stop_codon:yes gene_type:complete
MIQVELKLNGELDYQTIGRLYIVGYGEENTYFKDTNSDQLLFVKNYNDHTIFL